MIASEPGTRRRLKTINYEPDVAKVIARNGQLYHLRKKPEKRPLCFARITINKCEISFVACFTVRISLTSIISIHPCHTAAILSPEIKRALFYHAKPRNGNHGDEA